MKKIMILTLLLNVGNLVFGNEYIQKKVQEFPMGNYDNGIYLRKYEQVAPHDDITKNYLVFTTEGDLRIYQADSSRMIYLNHNFQIEKEEKMDLLIHAYDLMYTEKYLLMTDKIARIYLFDNQLQPKAYFELYDIFAVYGQGVCLTESYYDEASDIIFFKDTEDNMHSIIHPGMNDEENRKNYKNPEETLKLFSSNTYFTSEHISLYKNKYLVIDGTINYWRRQSLGKYTYQIVNSYYVNLWDGKNSIPIKFDYDSENEIESIAIHPCGDIYILRMDWQTNTHNLYCIENTWDPDYREEWYKNHSTDNSSQTASSATIVIDQQMSCIDNLSLRSEGSVSASVITTMKKGTKVKVLKLGNTETIDGMNSNWVQVEVLSGAKDQKGKKIKAGTIGWCYGGYLE